MIVYDWASGVYVDLLQLALDLTREHFSPSEVLDLLISYCWDRDIIISIQTLQSFAELAVEAKKCQSD